MALNENILVTGGAGYVGGHLIKALARHGYRVRLGTRRPDKVAVLPQGAERAVLLDLKDPKSLRQACLDVRHVIHLAATNEIESARDPVEAFEVNAIGTLRLVRAAQELNIERFVYFSTAHVYGAPLTGRFTENSVVRPTHPYAYTHRAAEDVVLAAHRTALPASVVFRLSNGIGAPERPDVDRWTLLVNDLCRQIIVDGRMQLKSSGLQRRDFVALNDVSAAVLHSLTCNIETLMDGLFNLGSGQSMSVLEMAELVAERAEILLGHRPPILRPEPTPDQQNAGSLDFSVEKLKQTGFVPRNDFVTEIDETLKACLNYFGKNT